MTRRKIDIYKRSRQRERILELLQGTETHPTAGWLYNKLIKEFPGLSMGTVYRNLTILLKQDLIKKIDFGSTFDRFDANNGPHYHFICEKCGSINDLVLPVDQSLNERVNQTTGHTAIKHRIEFFGLCEKCSK
jgi:Fur family peroxide stress response transcriptional regulator